MTLKVENTTTSRPAPPAAWDMMVTTSAVPSVLAIRIARPLTTNSPAMMVKIVTPNTCLPFLE
ncbi:hypothetical protein D3C80_2224490 [compost metagenome]